MKYDHSKMIQYVSNMGLRGNNISLMKGKVGLSIFLYHSAKRSNTTECEKFADNLLDQIFEILNASASSDFENGLAGIGWGIEYLVQRGFATGDTDEILEEIDSKVYKILNGSGLSSLELTNGLTGYLFYLIARQKKPTNSKSMAQWINRELLILVINKLDVSVPTHFSSITKEMHFDLFWRFPVLFFGLGEAFDLNIYNEKIRCMVTQWIMNLEAYLPSMHINRLYMATVLTLINARIPDSRLEKQIQILLFATDFDIIKTEIDPQALNIRYGWPGVAWLLFQASRIIPENCPNYQLINPTRKEIIRRYEGSLQKAFGIDDTNPERLGISEGLAGIGLMDLLWPEVLEENENCNNAE